MEETNRRERVLFVCTHNSARSQMAEGMLRGLYGDRFQAYSAGTKPTSVDPRAVSVMSEIGFDISGSWSKSVSEFLGMDIDYVITLCDDAQETCPFFPGAKEYLHRRFINPVDISEPGEAIAAFRQVRDDLKDWIIEIFGQLKKERRSGRVGLELEPR